VRPEPREVLTLIVKLVKKTAPASAISAKIRFLFFPGAVAGGGLNQARRFHGASLWSCP